MKYTSSFLDYLRYEKRYAKHTLLAYTSDLAQFADHCRESVQTEDPAVADVGVIRAWIADLMEAGFSARTVNRKITTLKTYYKYLMREQHIRTNPMDKVVGPRLDKKLPSFVEEKKMDQLLEEVAFGEDFKGMRNRLIIELLYLTGMRLSELINLEDKDVNLYDLTLKVTGKRNKERIIPFHAAYRNVFEDYLSVRKKTFPSPETRHLLLTGKGRPLYPKFVYNVVNDYLRLVTTMEKRSPHVLRHTFATHMLNRGADLNAIKELLGHANLSATQVYTHNTFEKLINIYKQAHPRA